MWSESWVWLVNSMRNTFIWICALYLCVSLNSCTSKVIHFTNSNTHFSDYETFSIVNLKYNKNISAEGQAIYDTIEKTISSEMVRRDYLENINEFDVVIRYELITNQSSNVTSNYNNSYGFYNPYPSYSVKTIQESALLLEMYDGETKKLIWQASMDLDKASKKNNKEQILEEAVTKLFNTYLYRAKTNTTDESLLVE